MIKAEIDDNQNVKLHMESTENGKYPVFIQLLGDLQCIVIEALNAISKQTPIDILGSLEDKRKFLLGAFIDDILETKFDNDKDAVIKFINEYLMKYLEVH